LKEALITIEEDLAQLSDKLQLEAQSIPNSTHPDVPVGGEESSVVRKEVEHFLYILPACYCTSYICNSFASIVQVGSQRNFNFTIKDHLQLGKGLDLFDFDAAAEV
jgi:seryl-tRNA synthetase